MAWFLRHSVGRCPERTSRGLRGRRRDFSRGTVHHGVRPADETRHRRSGGHLLGAPDTLIIHERDGGRGLADLTIGDVGSADRGKRNCRDAGEHDVGLDANPEPESDRRCPSPRDTDAETTCGHGHAAADGHTGERASAPAATQGPSLFQTVTPYSLWAANAELSGFTSVATGEPLIPAWATCSLDGDTLGWGLANGAAITVIAQGVGACAGWYVAYSAVDDVAYWVHPGFVAASPPAATTPSGGEVIQTCIDGTFEGWSGDTVFELCNGQVWVQTSYAYTYRYAYRTAVTLVRTGAGWVMSVDGVRDSISVQQVSFVRTCIESDFEGWSGDTVFVLCNGQIWQQADYQYWYHYAYRPGVLIYEAPSGGHRLKLEGADETIRIVRLR